MNKRTSKPGRIAFFGHFDGTNFGNESTLQAIIYHLRRIQPDVEVICICTGPGATATTYRVAAIPIARTFVRSWAPRNPLGKLTRKICVGLGEPFRWLEGIITLWGADMLIVPGTGLLTDAYGLLGFGPYSLLRWSAIAKICGCQLAFVSVGAGPIYGAAGRSFIKTVLSLADFRSYRDESTVRCLQGIGFSADRDRVFPDLAFSLPEPATSRHASAMGAGPVIGIGLMEYAGKYTEERPGNAAHMSYLQTLAETARWLLAHGYNVRLLSGDLADERARQAFVRLLRQHPPMYDHRRIVDEPIHTVEDLLSQIVATDAVMATRYHNVLLSLLCDKPVISISFHHKCESLMAAMGMSDYCLKIGDLEPDRLIQTFCRLEANRDTLKLLIRERINKFRDTLDQQYQLLFHGIQHRRQTNAAAPVLSDSSLEPLS
jgi:polysaccharide pyruvyl transferase WcaK-like protein